jgi:hypothetical protein
MSTVSIEIETDNDAFADGNIGNEVQRILSNILWQTSSNIKTGWELNCLNPKLKDLNGNLVGAVKITN